MSLSAEVRARLAAEQAALVAALVGGDGAPPGFEAARLRLAAAALARKRARAAARAWPGLARALGERFGGLFAAYAGAAPLPREGGPLADGRAFARWLAARDELPEAGRLQALLVDLRYAAGLDGLVPRRWPSCRIAWLRRSRRLLVAVCLPWLGVRRLSIPLGRRRPAEPSAPHLRAPD
jgi:hypothetical protein